MTQFYRAAIESPHLLRNSCQSARDKLEKVVKVTSKIIEVVISLLLPPNISHSWGRRVGKACKMPHTHTHPAGQLFRLLPLGPKLCTLSCIIARFRNSFYPQAVSAFNKLWLPTPLLRIYFVSLPTAIGFFRFYVEDHSLVTVDQLCEHGTFIFLHIC